MKKHLLPGALVLLIALLSFPLSAQTDGYRLKQVLVISRHNIRTPLTVQGSVLDSLTPHRDQWNQWSAGTAELTLHGGVCETIMGQYFNQWLVSEGLIPNNWQPKRNEAYFYANSKQRTIATARYFSAGMLPVADVRIKYRPNIQDRNFLPILTTDTEAFKAEAVRERIAMGGERGLDAIQDSLRTCYAVLEKVLDYEASPYYAKHKVHLGDDELRFVDIAGDEPRIGSLLRVANTASDALILQYYEEPDAVKAAFGHSLTDEEWEQIARIKDIYGDLLFSAPVVAVNTIHSMLGLMEKELGRKGRIFTFLCGHDSTIASVLAALDAEPYMLPGTIEKKTPIGVKLVLSRYERDGKDFARLELVYPTTGQLRGIEMISLDNPLMRFPVRIRGLEETDGYYRFEDLLGRIAAAENAGKGAPQGIAPSF